MFTLAHISDVHLGPLPDGAALRHFKAKRIVGYMSWQLERRKLHDPAVEELLLLLAGGLRFAKLGAWSFAGDEVASVQEADALLDDRAVTDDPITRLPRATPVGVAVHGSSYRSLGHSEFAARLPAAVAGALLCGIAVLGLWSTLGGWSATAVGLLLALNPECIFYSQYNRYYSLGMLFAVGSILCALQAVRMRSESWMVRACCLAAPSLENRRWWQSSWSSGLPITPTSTQCSTPKGASIRSPARSR